MIVVDESEHPIAGASVEVTTADPLPYAAVSGAESGAARVDRLGPPPYRVRAWASGYEDIIRAGVVPGATPLRIRLERPAALVVTVVGADGRPAPGATVLAAGTGSGRRGHHDDDEQGATRIGGLHGGVYDLKARLGDEVSRTELAVPVKRGEAREVKLTLEPGKRVRGHRHRRRRRRGADDQGGDLVLVEEGLSSFPVQGRTGR